MSKIGVSILRFLESSSKAQFLALLSTIRGFHYVHFVEHEILYKISYEEIFWTLQRKCLTCVRKWLIVIFSHWHFDVCYKYRVFVLMSITIVNSLIVFTSWTGLHEVLWLCFWSSVLLCSSYTLIAVQLYRPFSHIELIDPLLALLRCREVIKSSTFPRIELIRGQEGFFWQTVFVWQ